jgi:hypothetical protein
MQNNFIKSQQIKDILSDFTAFSLAKIILLFSSIANLIVSSTYVNAILKMENAICGFVMFMFVLLGLVVLFQAVRMVDDYFSGAILAIIACIITVIVGVYLYYLCNTALLTQSNLHNPQVVVHALNWMRVLIVGYGVGAILIVIHLIGLWRK